MTQAETLIALAERVEALEGPSREVDTMIFVRIEAGKPWIVGHEPGRFPQKPGWGTIADLTEWADGGDAELAEAINAPNYTASLDSAMELVPEGWVWTINQFPDKANAYLVNSVCQMARPRKQYQATPALALTAAALRARAEQVSS